MKTITGIVPFLSEEEVKNIISTQYGFNGLDCTLIGHLRSSIYQISFKYIFKVFGTIYHTLTHIQGEVELLHILHQQGVSVSYPIEDKSGKFVQILKTSDINCYGVLYSYAEGEVYEKMNMEQVTSLGRELGRMHRITADLKLKHQLRAFNLDSIFTIPLKEMKPAFHKMKEEYNYIMNIGNKVLLHLDELDLSIFDRGYIHNDLSPYNVHFLNDRITIFDFDNAGIGYLIQDIVSIYAHFFNEVRFNRISAKGASTLFNLFLDSYQQIRQLNTHQLEAIPYFGFAYIISGIHFVPRLFEEDSYQGYLNDKISLIRLWVKWHAIR